MGAARRHGRVFRVRRAADPPHAAWPAGPGRRARRPRRRRRRQLRGPGVRRPLRDADAPGPPAGRARLRWCCRRAAWSTGWPAAGSSTPCATIMPVLEQLSLDEAFGEPAELAGAAAAMSSGSATTCAPGCAPRPGWSPRSARDRASRSPRSPPDWPNPTGSGSSAATRNARCSTGCRCAGCGASARSPRRSCTASGIQTIGQFAALTDAEVADILGAHGRPRAAPAGARHRRPPGGRTRRGQADQRRVDLRRRPDDARTASRCGRADRRTRPPAPDARRSRRPDRHGQTEEGRYEHADPLGDAALRHRRRRHADRHRAPAAARSGRGRPDSPSRRWLFGSVARCARSRCFPNWTQGAELTDTRCRRRHRSRDAGGWRVGDDVRTTGSGATAGCRAPATA